MNKKYLIGCAIVCASIISGCSSNTTSNEEQNSTENSTEMTPTTQTDKNERFLISASGLEGEGPRSFKTLYFTFDAPQGLKYEVYTYAVNAEYHNGTIQIDFGKQSTTEINLHVSSTRMISSLDDAHDECIRTQNLDTFKEGKYEDLDDVTFNGTIYKAIHFTNEYSDYTCYATYFKRTSDNLDMYAELQVDNKGKSSVNDAEVIALLNSINYIKD